MENSNKETVYLYFRFSNYALILYAGAQRKPILKILNNFPRSEFWEAFTSSRPGIQGYGEEDLLSGVCQEWT